MALSTLEQRTLVPLATYNFRVTIDGATMSFAKVSGLAREHQTVTYRHGLSFAEGEPIAKFHVDRWSTVTLEQGTVIGRSFVSSWLERKEPSAVDISLCDAQGVPAITWSLAKALPVKLTAPTFDARSNELSIDSLELKASGITVKYVG